jgi:hypothetical protein
MYRTHGLYVPTHRPLSRYAVLRSISLLVVLAALGGCTTGSTRVTTDAAGRRSSLSTTLVGPMNRAYDCRYHGSNGGHYIAQCPSGYH